MAVVNIVYHHFPHYRRPVLRELAQSKNHEYRFWGSTDTVEGIKVFEGDDLVHIRPLRFRMWRQFWLVSGYRAALFDPAAKVLIVHGTPNMPASWIMGMFAPVLGKKVIFWVHGWLKKESGPKAWLRNLHYGLGALTMTYAERAASLAAQSGFSRNKVVPVYNSLDWSLAGQVLARLETKGEEAIRLELGMDPDELVLVCVARITKKCRFDILIAASSLLQANGVRVRVVLIGEGDEMSNLMRQADECGVQLMMPGAAYDEEVIGRYLFAADATVSPGKIGLSAMHSLMYGTPVFSHADLDNQMPEVEAIVSGHTGELFERDNAHDLANTLMAWRRKKYDRARIRQNCRAVIEARYNPKTQAALIDGYVSRVLASG